MRLINLYPLDLFKNKRNTLKIVSFDTNKIVTPQLGGHAYGNRRVPLSGPRFPKTPPNNPQDIHWKSKPV